MSCLRCMHIESDKCQLWRKCAESVMYLASRCQLLAGNEYLKRYNNTLKVLMSTNVVEKEMLKKDQYWYNLKWELETVIENNQVKLCRNFEYQIRTETVEVTIEYIRTVNWFRSHTWHASETKIPIRRLRKNYRSVSNWPIRPGRGDQLTMLRSSQWLLDAWEEVHIGWKSR